MAERPPSPTPPPTYPTHPPAPSRCHATCGAIPIAVHAARALAPPPPSQGEPPSAGGATRGPGARRALADRGRPDVFPWPSWSFPMHSNVLSSSPSRSVRQSTQTGPVVGGEGRGGGRMRPSPRDRGGVALEAGAGASGPVRRRCCLLSVPARNAMRRIPRPCFSGARQPRGNACALPSPWVPAAAQSHPGGALPCPHLLPGPVPACNAHCPSPSPRCPWLLWSMPPPQTVVLQQPSFDARHAGSTPWE